jgi:hypothetical protein
MSYERGPREMASNFNEQPGNLPGYERGDADQVRSIHLRLKPGDYRELVRRARLAGVMPWDLVITWVEEHLRRPDVSSEIDELKDLVLEYREAANKAFVRMERLERAAGDILGILGPAPAPPSEADRKANRLLAGKRRGAAARNEIALGRKPRLHEEIAAILREAGQPMSAADVAEQIAARGRYEGRGAPITSTIVNSRVSHPMYRHYFSRSNGLIGLAAEVGAGL